jgi:predicted RNA binding protein YcfA (HicA-like mRNA interferase family)
MERGRSTFSSRVSQNFEVAVLMILLVCLVRVRQLIADLEKHGFIHRGGKGSHRNFLHPSGVKITLSGALGDDAKHYQERDLKRAIRKVQSWARANPLITMSKSLPGAMKTNVTLVAAPALC